METISTAPRLDYCYYVVLPMLLLWPVVIFHFLGKRKVHNAAIKLPPGPNGWPIIGNIFNLDPRRPHISMGKLAETFGPVFSLRLGSRLMVVASTPEAAKEIFKTHDQVFSGRYEPHLSNKVPKIATSMIAISRDCNERWRFLRSTAHTELFSSRALESQSGLRVKKVKEMLELLSSKGVGREAVRIGDILFATIANIFTGITVSQDIIRDWSQIGELKRASRRLVEFGIPGLGDLVPSLARFDFSANRKAANYMETNRKVWGDIVSKRRSATKSSDVLVGKSQDFLDVLIRNSMDDEEIYNMLTELFLSPESLAMGIEWVMSELIKNQETMVKLKDELAKAFELGSGTAAINERQLSKLPYLHACIKETFRLHPPTPLLVPRCALQNCKLMDYDVPKNSWVIVSAYALGRDPKSWEEPLSFKPERFLEKSIELKGTHYELVPFGGGRRVCAGYPLAMKIMQLLLASLVHGFDWSLPLGTDPAKLDMTENFGFTLRRENPLLVIPKKTKDLNFEYIS